MMHCLLSTARSYTSARGGRFLAVYNFGALLDVHQFFVTEQHKNETTRKLKEKLEKSVNFPSSDHNFQFHLRGMVNTGYCCTLYQTTDNRSTCYTRHVVYTYEYCCFVPVVPCTDVVMIHPCCCCTDFSIRFEYHIIRYTGTW